MRVILLILIALTSPVCYSYSDICSDIAELPKVKIEQGSISQFIFGIDRSVDEITWLIKVKNIILSRKTNIEFYKNSKKCITQLQENEESYPINRSLKIVELDLLFGLGNSTRKRFSSQSHKKTYAFLLGNINTSDYMLRSSIIRTLGVFSTAEAADVLFEYILNKENKLNNRRSAIDSLSFMSSNYANKKLSELNKLVESKLFH